MNLRNILRKLSPDDIKRAVRYGNLERRRESLQGRLDAVLGEMKKLEGNGRASAPVRRKTRGRRKGFRVSAATRAKMKAAALRRYAAKGKTEAPSEGKRKRFFSPEARAKMAEAARRRWQKVKGTAEAKTAE